MSELLSYHPILKETIPVCASDCYPGKGIYLLNSKTYSNQVELYSLAGGCNGDVAGELGQICPADNISWAMTFNGPQSSSSSYSPTTDNQDIGMDRVLKDRTFKGWIV